VESRRWLASLASDAGIWDTAGPCLNRCRWLANRSSQPLGTYGRQEMSVLGMAPKLLTDARETSY
jgi:hypothetical protein